jgi:hypothetical protein
MVVVPSNQYDPAERRWSSLNSPEAGKSQQAETPARSRLSFHALLLYFVVFGALGATACGGGSAGASSHPSTASPPERALNACLRAEGATSIKGVGQSAWKVDFPNGQTFTWHLTQVVHSTSGKHSPISGAAGRAWRTCGRKLLHMKSTGPLFGTTPS